MINFLAQWPIAIVVVVIVVMAARRRLLVGAQPLRLSLATKGEELLADEGLPTQIRNHVGDMLDTAFGCRSTLLIGILFVPMLAVLTVIWPNRLIQELDETDAQLAKLKPEQRDLYQEIVRIHDRITLANHPFLLPALELQISFLMPLSILLLSLTRGRVPMKGDRDAVVIYIETRKHHVAREREEAAAA